jgi:hypothetical protein
MCQARREGFLKGLGPSGRRRRRREPNRVGIQRVQVNSVGICPFQVSSVEATGFLSGRTGNALGRGDPGKAAKLTLWPAVGESP